jgi:hypothetical protein
VQLFRNTFGVSPSTCLFFVLLIHAPNLSQASDALALSFSMQDDGRANGGMYY